MEYNLQKEKQEALMAGNRALSSLKEAKIKLDNASSWGVFDMFSKGFLSTFIKRSNMNDAKNCMNRARKDLEIFSRELQDVSMNFDLNIDLDGFLGFADYFFDNFFVDWMVQDQIHQAKSKVCEAIRQVEVLMQQLNLY